MLNSLDETIKRMLVESIPLDTSEVDVVFDAPNNEWKSSLSRPTLNCYLYHVIENRELRRSEWEVSTPVIRRDTNGNGNGNGGSSAGGGTANYGVATRRRSPFRIDASYMLTAWANEVEDEHRLLWRALAVFMRFDKLPVEFLLGDLIAPGQEWPLPLKVAQPSAIIKNPSDFWSSMEAPIKPSIDLTVTLPLDPELLQTAPLVLTKRVRTYPLDGPREGLEIPSQLGGWVFDGDATQQYAGPGGLPVAGAKVLLVENGLGTQTDEQGRFKFAGIPHGRYTLRAVSGSIQVERTIQVPGENYDLVMQPSGKSSAERTETSRERGPSSPRRGGKPAGGDQSEDKK